MGEQERHQVISLNHPDRTTRRLGPQRFRGIHERQPSEEPVHVLLLHPGSHFAGPRLDQRGQVPSQAVASTRWSRSDRIGDLLGSL